MLAAIGRASSNPMPCPSQWYVKMIVQLWLTKPSHYIIREAEICRAVLCKITVIQSLYADRTNNGCQFLTATNKKTLHLRAFFVFFFVLDTRAVPEALLRAVRTAAVVCRALCGLNNSGGGVRELALPVTCDLVFMRLVGAAAVRTFLPPRGGLGLGAESGVWSRALGEEALREALELRGVDWEGVVG